MTASTEPGGDVEFWRLETVMAKTGLSRSAIYRRQEDGTFPHCRSYRDGTRNVFWLSTEVQAWQRSVLEGA